MRCTGCFTSTCRGADDLCDSFTSLLTVDTQETPCDILVADISYICCCFCWKSWIHFLCSAVCLHSAQEADKVTGNAFLNQKLLQVGWGPCCVQRAGVITPLPPLSPWWFHGDMLLRLQPPVISNVKRKLRIFKVNLPFFHHRHFWGSWRLLDVLHHMMRLISCLLYWDETSKLRETCFCSISGRLWNRVLLWPPCFLMVILSGLQAMLQTNPWLFEKRKGGTQRTTSLSAILQVKLLLPPRGFPVSPGGPWRACGAAGDGCREFNYDKSRNNSPTPASI